MAAQERERELGAGTALAGTTSYSSSPSWSSASPTSPSDAVDEAARDERRQPELVRAALRGERRGARPRRRTRRRSRRPVPGAGSGPRRRWSRHVVVELDVDAHEPLAGAQLERGAAPRRARRSSLRRVQRSLVADGVAAASWYSAVDEQPCPDRTRLDDVDADELRPCRPRSRPWAASSCRCRRRRRRRRAGCAPATDDAVGRRERERAVARGRPRRPQCSFATSPGSAASADGGPAPSAGAVGAPAEPGRPVGPRPRPRGGRHVLAERGSCARRRRRRAARRAAYVEVDDGLARARRVERDSTVVAATRATGRRVRCARRRTRGRGSARGPSGSSGRRPRVVNPSPPTVRDSAWGTACRRR